MSKDFRYALRLLGRSPGFALVAITTVALGIGVNVAMFSVASRVLLAPLPYPEPERLVRIFEETADTPLWPVAPGNFVDYRQSVPSLEAAAAYERSDLQLFEGDRAEHLRAMRVTSGFFALLGARPIVGRELGVADEIPEAEPVVVLGHAFWQRRFAGDPAIVGRSLLLSGRPFRVVGVLPAGFEHIGGRYRSYGHAEPVDVWWPRSVAPVSAPRNQHYLNVVARLAPGATLAQAQADIGRLSSDLAKRFPRTNGRWTTRLVEAREDIVGPSRAMVIALVGAVQLVLLLACANVAGLLIGRSAGRAREIGVRAALGATRLRIARQLIVESFVIAIAGGVAGLALAMLLVRLIVAFGPADVPRLQTVTLDSAILLYALAATSITSLLFGLAPAWQLARTNVSHTLKEGGRGAIAQQRLRRVLVAAEIALAFVLVVAAGLLLRSFSHILATDPGFKAEGVLTAVVNLPSVRYDDKASGAFYQRLIDQIATMPSVRAAGLGSALPWTGYDENTGFGIAGRTFPPNEGPEARYNAATPGFFGALSVPLEAGRDISPGDTKDAPKVVLVNRALAVRYFGTPASAIDARLDLWGSERTIVGVVGDVKDTPWSAGSEPALYFPKAQQTVGGDMVLAVRTDGDPSALAGQVQRVLHALDPALPLASVRTMDEVVAVTYASRRFTLALCAGFGVSAVFLAMVGIYGVMMQSVAERAREFGVRQALGARPSDILRIVMRSGIVVGAAGVAAGALLALAGTRVLSSLLYETEATDATTYVAVAGLLLVAALAASYLPARRGMKTDPVESLR